MGRFSRLAQSEYLRSPSSTDDNEVGVASQENRAPISYNVEVVSLVIVESGRRRCESVSSETNGRVRNFKKFRKVLRSCIIMYT